MSAKRRINKMDLIRFRASFSPQQKIAIVGSLFRMAFADGDFSEEEVEFVVAICELLGYEVKEEEIKSYVADPLFYLNSLLDLNEAQKIWYCRALYYMLVMDGKVDIRELDKLAEYLEILGIDQDTFYRFIQME